jgi:sigma-B regulation protein RsbU (phosphoserine phosphatase)
VEKIDPGFQLKIDGYPQFEILGKERTILGNETNETLRQKGIFKYSATGVGDKIKIDKKPYYEYLLAFNSDHINEEFRITLNIIATAITSQIKQKRYSLRQSFQSRLVNPSAKVFFLHTNTVSGTMNCSVPSG